VLNPANAISGAAGIRITWGWRFAVASGVAVTFSGAACDVGKSAKQPISSGMRSEAHSQDAWFVEFLRFVLKDLSVLRIIFFISADFVARVGFWEYAELRTNALARRFRFLLGKPTGNRYVPDRSLQLGSISFVSADAARS
jgi:hypothetical protein